MFSTRVRRNKRERLEGGQNDGADEMAPGWNAVVQRNFKPRTKVNHPPPRSGRRPAAMIVTQREPVPPRSTLLPLQAQPQRRAHRKRQPVQRRKEKSNVSHERRRRRRDHARKRSYPEMLPTFRWLEHKTSLCNFARTAAPDRNLKNATPARYLLQTKLEN